MIRTGPLAEQLAGKQAPTQLGGALQQHPADPRLFLPKPGRIERAWRTCQDRLVSELRLAQATPVEQAKVVLVGSCTDYNQRFARSAAEATCDFRRLPARFDLARCLSLHYQRTVAADHTVTLGAQSIAVPPLSGHRGYAGETVELSHQLDGVLRVFRGDVLLLARPLAARRTRRSPAPDPPLGAETKIAGRPALAAVT